MLTRIKLPAFLIVCLLGGSLLNFGYFGNISLSAYFGFCFLSIFISLLAVLRLFRMGGQVTGMGLLNGMGARSVFAGLTFYIIVHGLLDHNFNLTQYYWLAATAVLFSIGWIARGDRNFLSYLHPAIVLIAVMESLVVFLQYTGLAPSMNQLFTCTGTWANPNVTAMFLALSLFSQRPLNQRPRKLLLVISLVLTLLAIVLLQCRTAYLVAIILLLEPYSRSISSYKRPVVLAAVIVVILSVFAFGFKTGSTGGRLQVWKNSLSLIGAHPLAGIGFGQFEKEYNLFVAGNDLPSADHVYMPYNDFLELAVEGGIVAVVLWMVFLLLLFRQFKNDPRMLALVISFIVAQSTNFAFQAIPVFALFLVYAGANLPYEEKIKLGRPLVSIAMILVLLAGVRLFLIASAFHMVRSVKEEPVSREAMGQYQELSTTLGFSSSYQETGGDLWMRLGDYSTARLQYIMALKTTSRPDVLGKCGWCYGQLGKYDSAVYYFGIIEKLQPYKYAPRMALLRLYEQKKDTVSIRNKAREIIAMPVKVPGAEVDRMKEEAHRWVGDKNG